MHPCDDPPSVQRIQCRGGAARRLRRSTDPRGPDRGGSPWRIAAPDDSRSPWRASSALSLAFAGPIDAHAPSVSVLARHLDNPRGIAVGPGGRVLVAVAGRGGPAPSGYGLTGRIAVLAGGHVRTYKGSLPSIISDEGASGPVGVSVDRWGRVYGTIGGGPQTLNKRFGTVMRFRPHQGRDRRRHRGLPADRSRPDRPRPAAEPDRLEPVWDRRPRLGSRARHRCRRQRPAARSGRPRRHRRALPERGHQHRLPAPDLRASRRVSSSRPKPSRPRSRSARTATGTSVSSRASRSPREPRGSGGWRRGRAT